MIRRLRKGEGLLYREVRLEALKESPDAFLSKYEDALQRSDDSWGKQCDASSCGSVKATFIIEDVEPLALAAIYRDNDSSTQGELLQMWVSPKLRGSGAAKNLLNSLFKWAAESGLLKVRAEVNRANGQALSFYKKFGFVASADYDFNTTIVLEKKVS